MRNTYIITGAGKGIGHVFAKSGAKLGHNLALISRTISDLESLKKELQLLNRDIKISIHSVDLGDPSQTKKAFNDIYLFHENTIKTVVCFAGAWVKSKPIETLEASDILEGLQANFFPTFNTIKETLRINNQILNGLVIIIIGGTSSVWMNPEAPIMSVAKGAISNYSRILAKQLLPKGEIMAFQFTKATTDDRKPVPDLVQHLIGKLIGDKGYLSQKLSAQLTEQGLHLLTRTKKNMKNQLMVVKDKLLLRKRAIIECVYDQLKNISQIKHTRHRSITNFCANLLAALMAYALQPKKPSIYSNRTAKSTELALIL